MAKQAAAPLPQAARSTVLHLLILAGATFLLYARTLAAGFVADDEWEVLSDRLIRSFSSVPALFAHSVWFFGGYKINNYYRPLKLLAYLVEYHLFGFHPAWWHLANIFLHLAIVVTIYFLVRDLASATLGFWSALLFAIHPVHVEAVAWIAAGNDLLCALALLLALWFYHRARAGHGAALPQLGLSAILFFAGLLSKETALTFPATILAYDFLYRGDTLRQMARGWSRYLAYFVALGVYLAMRFHALGGFAPGVSGIPLTPAEMVWAVPVLAVRHLWLALLPAHLNYWHVFVPVRRLGIRPLAAMVLVALLVLPIFWLRRRQPLISLALAWFWITLIPALDIPRIGIVPLSERYLYAPTFGFCVVLAWAWLWVRDRPSPLRLAPFAYSGLAATLLFYGIVAARRLPDWHDTLALYTKTALQDPNDAYAQAQMGFACLGVHRYWDAIYYSQRAIALNPGLSYVYNNLGSAYLDLGRYDQALPAIRKAIALNPGFAPFRASLAVVYRAMNQWQNVAQTSQAGLALDPNNHALLTLLGLAQWHLGQRDQAVASLRRAVQAEPDTLDAYIDLANSLAQLGQVDAATGELLAALRANPNSPDLYLIHFELGVMYVGRSMWRPAAYEFQQSLKLKPDFAPARDKLQPLLPFLNGPRP